MENIKIYVIDGWLYHGVMFNGKLLLINRIAQSGKLIHP